MRAVIQRVQHARVEVEGAVVGAIEQGLVVFLGISRLDTESDAGYLVDKIANLRVFPDSTGKMNLSVRDIQGSLLIVSQFTLYGDCAKGRRPSFDSAAPPEQARRLYDYFVAQLRVTDLTVATGVFQASMEVTLQNSGPVTIICDSPLHK